MLISIIIPAYNEASTIKILINKIKKIKINNQIKFEIIVVNDGSTDDTKKIVSSIKNIRLINQSNKGKGKAVQNGIKIAKGKFILIQDADLEYSPKDYSKMLKPIIFSKDSIVVYGRRKKSNEDKSNKVISWLKKHPKQPFTSWFANILLTLVFLILYFRFISDTLTGYKIYPRAFFIKNKIYSKGFEADHEITIKLIRNNYKILEVPINFSPRSVKEGKKISFKDFLIAIYVTAKYRILF